MKILIVPIILLIAASIASAQVSLSASVQADVDSIIAIAKARLAASINAGNSAIQGVTSAYTRATGTARNLIVTILNRLGSRGQEAATRVSSDINNAVNSTTTQINNQLTQLQQYLNNSVQYVNNALQSDTDKLKAAINANSSAIKCWLDNRDKIRALVKSAGAQSVSIVTAGGAALSSQNLKLVATASKAVQRIEADVLLKCGSSRTCAETYFTNNYDVISEQFKGYGNQTVSQVSAAIADIENKSNVLGQNGGIAYGAIAASISNCISAYLPQASK